MLYYMLNTIIGTIIDTYYTLLNTDYITYFYGKEFRNAIKGPYFTSDRYDYPYVNE
jgi:hypothetical protein